MSGSDDTSRKQPNAQIKYKDIRFCEMTERAALIKWWDALDAIRDVWNECSVEEGLRLARLSSHPDAQWLVSLFPPGAEETREHMRKVMKKQRDDPRAMYLARTSLGKGMTLLRRAAESCYAPAQAELSFMSHDDAAESFKWAQRAFLQGNRRGIYYLGTCYSAGRGCKQDEARARELFRIAAELGYAPAQQRHGEEAFGANDWERYYWIGCAAPRGYSSFFCDTVSSLMPVLEAGKQSRVLHNVALTFV
jgi:hypothetical protein